MVVVVPGVMSANAPSPSAIPKRPLLSGPEQLREIGHVADRRAVRRTDSRRGMLHTQGKKAPMSHRQARALCKFFLAPPRGC